MGLVGVQPLKLHSFVLLFETRFDRVSLGASHSALLMLLSLLLISQTIPPTDCARPGNRWYQLACAVVYIYKSISIG